MMLPGLMPLLLLRLLELAPTPGACRCLLSKLLKGVPCSGEIGSLLGLVDAYE